MSVTKRTRTNSGNKRTFYHAEVYVRGIRVQEQTFETQAAAYVLSYLRLRLQNIPET